MVERSSSGGDTMTRILGLITAIGIIATFLYPIITGSGATSASLSNINQHLSVIDDTLKDFRDRFDRGPRNDQLTDLGNRETGLSGRVDGLEHRINDLEVRLATASATLNNIDRLSRENLTHK